MKVLRFAIMTVLFGCVFESMEAMAGQVYGSSSIVYDFANNKVRGYSRTELDYDTAEYYTAFVCGSLYKNGVEQVRSCGGGFITASINTQFTGVSSTSSLTSDHYVDMQYFDEGNQSYVDYTGYSFLPGYQYPNDWLFYPANIFAYYYPVSIHLGSTDVQSPFPKYFSALSVLDANLGCAANTAGYGVQVKYQVLDQNSAPLNIGGMTPKGLVTVTDDAGNTISQGTQYLPFATPEATDSTGKFTDIPVGTCFGPPVPSQNFCVNSTQFFRIAVTVGGTTTSYEISGATIARDCVQGVRVSTLNPEMQFIRGTVN